MLHALPNIDPGCIDVPDINRLRAAPLAHPPRILLLYGSLALNISTEVSASCGR